MIEPTNFDYLQDKTKEVLSKLIATAPFLSNYSLVGGSALALYLCHRRSEDLDFFTYGDSFNRQELLQYLRQFEVKEVLSDNGDQMDVLLDGVKVTFFNAKWEFLTPDILRPLNIASLEAIAAMKTNVLFFLRAKFRDYYDLYFLIRKVMSLQKVFECARPLVTGLNFKLFCVALTYIDDIEDDHITHLDPQEVLSKQAIRSYFEKEIRNCSV
ncbi:MAG: nucleotidyl transferase AbiEii/AbiGii toxin family protein [Desulfuromonadales bacterium]